MPRYKVTRDFSGYVRGYETREVEADSEEEAKDSFYSGVLVYEEITRDDTHSDYSARLVAPTQPAPILTAVQQKLLSVATDFILRKK